MLNHQINPTRKLVSANRLIIPVQLLLYLLTPIMVFAGNNVLHQEGYDHQDMTQDSLYVIEFVMARDVVEREPVEIVTSYDLSNARAWCFARIHNSQELQDVFFKWYYEGELYFEMNSKIGISPNWRTYSSVGLQPGSWNVELLDSDGNILGKIHFHVKE